MSEDQSSEKICTICRLRTARPGWKSCEECREKTNAKAARNRAAGLCSCGNKPVAGRKVCERCRGLGDKVKKKVKDYAEAHGITQKAAKLIVCKPRGSREASGILDHLSPQTTLFSLLAFGLVVEIPSGYRIFADAEARTVHLLGCDGAIAGSWPLTEKGVEGAVGAARDHLRATLTVVDRLFLTPDAESDSLTPQETTAT